MPTPKLTIPQGYVTLKQYAEERNISPKTVKRQCVDGKLAYKQHAKGFPIYVKKDQS